MKIALFGINYEPEIAGIAPYTGGLARHLVSEGHQVSVVTGVPHYPQWRRLPNALSKQDIQGLSVRRINHYVPKNPRAIGRAVYELSWFLAAAPFSLRRDSDAAIGVVPSLSGAILASMLATYAHIPLGLIYHDLIGSAAKESGYIGGGAFARASRFLEVAAARRASSVAIVAEGFRAYFEAGGVLPARIVRVRNWASSSAPSATRNEARRQLGWRPDEFICLHAGNMGQKQGLDNLIASFALIRGGQIRLVLAGDGNDRQRLQRLAGELKNCTVQFLGVQAPGAYEATLSAADLLLLSQRASVRDMALPSKLSSYLASGRPILAAISENSEAARELLASGGGVIVEPERPERLANAILAMASNEDWANGFGAKGKVFAERELSRVMALQGYGPFLRNLGVNTVNREKALVSAYE